MNAAENLINSIYPQLIQQIDGLIHEKTESAIEPLEDRFSWFICSPYAFMKFKVGICEYTIYQTYNLYSVLFGVGEGHEFADKLLERIKEVATWRINLFLKQKEAEEEYVAEARGAV